MQVSLLLTNQSNYDDVNMKYTLTLEKHWKETIMYKLTKKEPSEGWKRQYKRILLRNLKKDKFL